MSFLTPTAAAPNTDGAALGSWPALNTPAPAVDTALTPHIEDAGTSGLASSFLTLKAPNTPAAAGGAALAISG